MDRKTKEQRYLDLSNFYENAKPCIINFAEAGTGFGKTYWITNYDFKQKTVLCLTSRKRLVVDIAKGDNKNILCSTYHNYKNYESLNPDIIICDEFHSAVSESGFAKQLQVSINWINEKRKNPNVTILAMSATPVNAIKALNKIGVKSELKYTGGKVHVPETLICSNGKEPAKHLKAFMELSLAESLTEPSVIFHQTATSAYKAYLEYPEISTVITSDNSSTVKIKGEIYSLNEEKFLAHRECIYKTQLIPDGIKFVHTTAVLQEGININEKQKLQGMHLSFDYIEPIIQSIGRLRSDVKKVYLNTPNPENLVEDIIEEIEGIDQVEEWCKLSEQLESNHDFLTPEEKKQNFTKIKDILLKINRSKHSAKVDGDSRTYGVQTARRAYLEVVLEQMLGYENAEEYAQFIAEQVQAKRTIIGAEVADLVRNAKIQSIKEYFNAPMPTRELNEIIKNAKISNPGNQRGYFKTAKSLAEYYNDTFVFENLGRKRENGNRGTYCSLNTLRKL